MNNNLMKKFFFLLSLILVNISFAKQMDKKELELIQKKNFKVSLGENLVVKTDVGDVVVKSWDKNEVDIKIFGNKNAESKMEYSFNQDENTVEVIGEREGGKIFGWFSKIDLKYEIMVPKEFNLELKTSGGDLVSKTIDGKLDLKTSGGDIFVENSKGKLNASTSGGDIVLEKFNGNSDVATSGGDIQISDARGLVNAATSGGDVVIKSADGEVNAETSGGDIFLDYSGKDQNIKLSTSGGDIDVIVPSKINADAEIKTSGGSIRNNFSNTNIVSVTKTKLIGKLNQGGKRLICTTSGGDIQLSQK
ncbi:MAG: DUF4097 family beta strand repeat protein [Ignavibacteriae bacterium]|nr:DUF4097 family beta strand repeat protein [Ignavibacteriota bacterium]